MANQTLPAIFSCFLLIFSIQLLLLSLASAQESGSSTSQSSQSPSLRSAGLIWVKICCLVIVFVATFLGGISPYFYKWNSSFLVLGTQFAGGVFLASALIHFLSDANKTFQERTDVAYPFAFMLAAAGYLLTMYGDCVIQWIFTRQASGGRVNVEKGDVTSVSTLERSSEVSSTRTGEKDARRKRCCEEEEEESTNVELKISVPANASDNTCISCGQSGNCCKCADNFSKPGELRNIVKATLIPTSSFADSALLIIALCFHSVFEGIAIGVAETKLDAWKALWTVCLHKIFAAISMGIALLRMIPNRPFISTACYSLFFAVSSPVGIIIGILIDATTEGPVADWIYAISMGFASGIFIYIAINHILVRGYVPPCQVAVDAPFYKFVAVLTGAFVIAVVMIWDS